MPFKTRNGSYYYESVELLSNKFFKKENLEQYIALCPECSARYNEFVLQNDAVMEELKKHMLNETKLELELGDQTREQGEKLKKSIRFVNQHLLDLQTILRKENNG